MSISNIDSIIKRIEVATKESPIAVFKSGKIFDRVIFDAVFGATIDAKKRILEDAGYIGTYFRAMDMKQVRQTLMEVE